MTLYSAEWETRPARPSSGTAALSGPRGSAATHPGGGRLLADKAAAFTLSPGVRVLREEQLGSVQHIHEHRQLGLDQGPQPVLQRRHNVLGGSTPVSRRQQGENARFSAAHDHRLG